MSYLELVQVIISFLNMAATVFLTIAIFRFTKKSQVASMVSVSKGMVNQFDIAIAGNDENANDISLLRAPAPGLTKRQEHLLFIYLNHLEYTFCASKEGLISKELVDKYCEDCLSYFRNSPEALSHMLGCGYPAEFIKMVAGQYRQLYAHEFTVDLCVHPTIRSGST